MSEFNYSDLQQLIDAEDYINAEAFCLAALDAGLDPLFWRTQLGYVYFLNEDDVDAHYVRLVEVFDGVVKDWPADDNAHFWLGYVYLLILNDIENAKTQLHDAVALKPTHSYANLVLAGMTTGEQSVSLLRQALKDQPNNFRALRQLSEVLLTEGRKDEALEILRPMLIQTAYVENDYGIMNRYINDVLTGATHEELWREEAKAKLD